MADLKINTMTDNAEGHALCKHQAFGMELEVEGVRDNFALFVADLAPWSVRTDGSLRNHGMEFVTTTPLSIDSSYAALIKFYTWLNDYSFQRNIRTSMHVHADMRTRTANQVRSILTAYCLVEPILMTACGENRESNIYCVPYYRANDDLFTIYRALTSSESKFRDVRDTCKYSAVYTEPLIRFGTVEFRQAPVWGTSDEAFMWMQMLNNLIRNSENYAPEDLLEEFISTGARTFGKRMLGSTYYWAESFVTETTVDELCEKLDVIRQATILCGKAAQAKVGVWSPETLTVEAVSRTRSDSMFRAVPLLHSRNLHIPRPELALAELEPMEEPDWLNEDDDEDEEDHDYEEPSDASDEF